MKEFLPKTVVADVINEASLLSSLCHPYLPLLFGVCTHHRPLRLMQFHAFQGLDQSTVHQELQLLWEVLDSFVCTGHGSTDLSAQHSPNCA